MHVWAKDVQCVILKGEKVFLKWLVHLYILVKVKVKGEMGANGYINKCFIQVNFIKIIWLRGYNLRGYNSIICVKIVNN